MYTPREQKWLDTYHEKVAKIWAIWFEDRQRGGYGGLSMSERDELLGKMRDKLYRLQKRVETVKEETPKPRLLAEVARSWELGSGGDR